MRKQARRLWFGDWQRDQEPTRSRAAAGDPGADTVVFMPDDEDGPRSSNRKRNLQRGALLVAIAVFIAAVFALSSGGDKQLTSERTEAPQTQAPQVPQPQIPQVPQGAPPQGFGGPDLTGAAAAKAARAALAKFPGDIERVTRDSTGAGYVVHVIEADGNEVHVLVDGQFHVRGSDAGSQPGTPVPGRSQ
jgi:hypothetical protein